MLSGHADLAIPNIYTITLETVKITFIYRVNAYFNRRQKFALKNSIIPSLIHESLPGIKTVIAMFR